MRFNSVLATGGSRAITLWNTETKKCKSVSVLYDTTRLLFVGDTLLSASMFLRAYDTHTLSSTQTMHGHYRPITSCVSRDGRVVTSAEDGFVKEWDLRCGKCVKSLDLKVPLSDALVRGGWVFVSDHAGYIYKIGASTHKKRVSCGSMALSLLGDKILAYDRKGGVHVVDPEDLSSAPLRIEGGHRGYGIKCAADEGGARAAFSSSSGLFVCDGKMAAEEGVAPIGEIQGKGWVWDIAFSRDGSFLAGVSSSGSIMVLGMQDPQGLREENFELELSVDYPLKAIALQAAGG